ncbi:MAG: hypothetical protein QOH76_1810 [Thermoleophilaceae bacterium]|jgi:uncharacterized protein (DUF1800 family)|nr:hypothetical protein [Thermoleophilaceae bacterium]
MSHAPIKQPPPGQPPKPPTDPRGDGGPPIYGRDVGNAQIKRLLWRAGFGPRPGEVDALAGKPLAQLVQALTRPQGAAKLNGPEPSVDGGPIAPLDTWGHDHLWWLDRMVRSDQQLVERMTLIWHDWFATSNDAVGSARLMIDQNELFRRNALGSFKDLLLGVTQDPAMLIWLNGIENRKGAPNENYAREVMELFALGADRGAYSEDDVRQLALALTGWRADWVDPTGWQNFRYDDRRHDHKVKTVFGKTGDFDWRAAVQLVLENPFHASFFVTKLWSYFIPTAPDSTTQAALQKLYLDSGYGIRPVVEAILMHPDFHAGAAMVKPPIVYTAGLLRSMGRAIDVDDWAWLCDQAGQMLFYPPNVSGWNDSAWLDTSTWRGRFQLAVYALRKGGSWNGTVDPWKDDYSKTEDAATAVARAVDFAGNPTLTSDTRGALLQFASTCLPATMASWEQGPYRAMRQNALRQLIVTSPDCQTS